MLGAMGLLVVRRTGAGLVREGERLLSRLYTMAGGGAALTLLLRGRIGAATTAALAAIVQRSATIALQVPFAALATASASAAASGTRRNGLLAKGLGGLGGAVVSVKESVRS